MRDLTPTEIGYVLQTLRTAPINTKVTGAKKNEEDGSIYITFYSEPNRYTVHIKPESIVSLDEMEFE